MAALLAIGTGFGSASVQAGGGDLSYQPAASHSCYARVDGHAAITNNPDTRYAGPLPGGGATTLAPATEVSLENNFGFDVGFGCGRSYMSGGSTKDAPVHSRGGFRADVTYTYRGQSDYESVPPLAPPQDPIQTSISSHAVMFNAYYDVHSFDTSGVIQPYIGAGIGVARVSMGDVTVVNGPPVSFDGNDQWNFAWQLMAGVGIKVQRGMTLDVGYRFASLGDISTRAPAFQNGARAGTSRLEIDDIYSHEFRVGLRFDIGRH
jgi:opacity protein-like surface antigen